jgi:dUTP pyrophosphatase
MSTKITYISHGSYAPSFATPGSAGIDLQANIHYPVLVSPGSVELIDTGVSFHIGDPSIVGLLFPRSGKGHSLGMVLGNLVGVIDSDYQGEVKVSVWNRSSQPFTIESGDRIAQLVFVRKPEVEFELVSSFETVTSRGEGGFGHTGN